MTCAAERRGSARPTMVGPRRGDFAIFNPLNAHFISRNCIFRPPLDMGQTLHFHAIQAQPHVHAEKQCKLQSATTPLVDRFNRPDLDSRTQHRQESKFALQERCSARDSRAVISAHNELIMRARSDTGALARRRRRSRCTPCAIAICRANTRR